MTNSTVPDSDNEVPEDLIHIEAILLLTYAECRSLVRQGTYHRVHDSQNL